MLEGEFRPLPLETMIRSLNPSRDSDWSEVHFKANLLALMQAQNAREVLEIGGGRKPIFEASELSAHGIAYAISDISAGELALAPEGIEKQCFDIGGSAVPDRQYDFIYSRKVFEHVANVEQAYRNVFTLLKPGGVVLNFIPTLYCPPLVMNHLLPEAVSSRILTYFQPHRNPKGEPKFPSYYRWCTASSRVEAQLQRLGFQETAVLPFYGHHYFDKVPVLKHVHPWCAGFCKKHDVRLFASRVYLMARKPA